MDRTQDFSVHLNSIIHPLSKRWFHHTNSPRRFIVMDGWRNRAKRWARENLNTSELNQWCAQGKDIVHGLAYSSNPLPGVRSRTSSLDIDAPTVQPYELAGELGPRWSFPSMNNGFVLPFPLLATNPSLYLRRTVRNAASSITDSITEQVPAQHRSEIRRYRRRLCRLAAGPQDPDDVPFDPHFGEWGQDQRSAQATEYLIPYQVVFNATGEWVNFKEPHPESEEYKAYKGSCLAERRRKKKEADREAQKWFGAIPEEEEDRLRREEEEEERLCYSADEEGCVDDDDQSDNGNSKEATGSNFNLSNKGKKPLYHLSPDDKVVPTGEASRSRARKTWLPRDREQQAETTSTHISRLITSLSLENATLDEYQRQHSGEERSRVHPLVKDRRYQSI
jgi:hypothetical protein